MSGRRPPSPPRKPSSANPALSTGRSSGSSDRGGYYHREWPQRQQLIKWAQRTYGIQLPALAGSGNPAIRGRDLQDLYASIDVVLGDSCLAGSAVPVLVRPHTGNTRAGRVPHPPVCRRPGGALPDGPHSSRNGWGSGDHGKPSWITTSTIRTTGGGWRRRAGCMFWSITRMRCGWRGWWTGCGRSSNCDRRRIAACWNPSKSW